MLLLQFRPRVGFDPFAEMRRMQSEMNRLFADFETGTAPEFPAVNLWASSDGVMLTAEIPGVKAEDVDLSVHDDLLTLKGKRLSADEQERASFHRRERPHGSFSRTVKLPFRVDPQRVQARFANGVLEVALLRPESERPKNIAIQSH